MKSVIVLTLLAVVVTACSGTSPDVRVFPVDGFVHAGPTCPVEQNPPDPACADRPVPDAELVVLDDVGNEVARVRSDAAGRFRLDLPAGKYTLVPQPVEGLLGTAAEFDFAVPAAAPLDVAYDTGIR